MHFNAGVLPPFPNDVTLKAAEDALHTLMGPPCIPPDFFHSSHFSPKTAFVRTFRGSFPACEILEEGRKVVHVCILNAKVPL